MYIAYENKKKSGQININHICWRHLLYVSQNWIELDAMCVIVTLRVRYPDNVVQKEERKRLFCTNFVFNTYMKSFNVFNNCVSRTWHRHVNLPLIRSAMHLFIRSHLNIKAPRDCRVFVCILFGESILENLSTKCASRINTNTWKYVIVHVRDNVRIV